MNPNSSVPTLFETIHCECVGAGSYVGRELHVSFKANLGMGMNTYRKGSTIKRGPY